jgi:sucrose phosphorylase
MSAEGRGPGPALPGAGKEAHLPAPDYERPLLELSAKARGRFLEILSVLYGSAGAEACFPELLRLMRSYYAHKTPALVAADRELDRARRFDERDLVLITYGDLVQSPGRRPLEALSDLLSGPLLDGAFNTVHLLPFFPYSSDRGFAVIDFQEVDPRLGSWDDIARLGERYELMFDGVFNHVSSKSRWFQRFLNCRPGYESYFVTFSTGEEISRDHRQLILRPRTTELLTPFRTMYGVKWVWTTFGPDQVDLNFRNPEVLYRVVETLLLYARRGADIVRLDAVTYIWRELGTRCAHLVQTHALVQLFRAILDAVSPRVALITETNVPHEDNVSYFGDGWNEAQMVYNFALPPLTLHTFLTGDATRLAAWADGLETPSPATTYFNFLDSHDGIGLLGARGELGEDEIAAMVRETESRGGLVSYRSDGAGGESPYELNITWYSALNREAAEDESLQVARFVASRSIALVLAGVPGVYLPSLFGTKNHLESVRAGGGARAINRDTIDLPALERRLADPTTWVARVAAKFGELIRVRVATPAFHPGAGQRILRGQARIFAVLRRGLDDSRLLALTNVTSEEQTFDSADGELLSVSRWIDRLSGRLAAPADGRLKVRLDPYQVVWLVAG